MKRLVAFTYRVGYPVAKLYWFLRRPTTQGVRCIVIHDDNILLIRHTYGSRLLTTVGGGIHKNETLLDAVIRETKEEVGLTLRTILKIAQVNYYEEFKNDTIHVFIAEAVDNALLLDESEILEASWYPLSNVPQDTSPLFKQFFDLAKPFIHKASEFVE